MQYLGQFLTDFAHSKIELDYIALALHVYVLKMTIYRSDIHVFIRAKRSPIKTILVILVKLIRLADIVFLQEVFYNIVPCSYTISLLCKYGPPYPQRPILKSKYHLLEVISSYFRGHHRVQRPRIAHKQHWKYYCYTQFFDLEAIFCASRNDVATTHRAHSHHEFFPKFSSTRPP